MAKEKGAMGKINFRLRKAAVGNLGNTTLFQVHTIVDMAVTVTT
jgi:hypothetical protein